MKFAAKFISELASTRTDCLVIPVAEKKKLRGIAADIDKACGGLISKRIADKDFVASSGKTFIEYEPSGLAAKRLLLMGTGKESLSDADLNKSLEAACKVLIAGPCKNAVFSLAGIETQNSDETDTSQRLAKAFLDQSYQYTHTKASNKKPIALKQVTVATADKKISNALGDALQRGAAIGSGMNAAKELGNLPANICTPGYLAKQAKALAAKHPKLSCKVLDEKQMHSLGMGSFLSVTAGTEEPAKLIVLEYHGGKEKDKPTVFVGKGITFDSGGISLKPGPKMDEMKYDMCGAASVMGVFNAVVELSPAINVVGIIAAAENLPSGKATKPGDVVTSMSGKTIEILNTDAEGRLVLCDTLTFAERYKPKAVIDIATLTGACIVALGSVASGLYSNQQELADKLLAAGEKAQDRAWHMPLWDEYQKQLDSNFADIANIGGPEAGSVTAACFLSRFTENYHWAHLDIAGTAWTGGTKKGATGRPVPLLLEYLLG